MRFTLSPVGYPAPSTTVYDMSGIDLLLLILWAAVISLGGIFGGVIGTIVGFWIPPCLAFLIIVLMVLSNP